jgi:protein-arginine kinase activator protein McsA
MYALSDGKCNICNKKEKKLHVDHCHKTKKVRGLLCGSCNKGLGLFKDDKESLLEAAEYLKRS